MSILIEGMEMPDSCNHCFVTPGCCPAVRKRIKSDKPGYKWIPANYRHEDCPLIEVPAQHGRLIDADAPISLIDTRGEKVEVTVAHIIEKNQGIVKAVVPASEGGM